MLDLANNMRLPPTLRPGTLLAAVGSLLAPRSTVQVVGDVYLDVIAKVEELTGSPYPRHVEVSQSRCC